MELYHLKIIESTIVLFLFIAIRYISNKVVNKTTIDKIVQKSRSQHIKKAINFIVLSIALIILLIIWGVKQADLALFVGSILTVIGVAMFAQWSLLSNITSSILLFFNHSVKIGDKISIMETKDYEIQGIVLDIGLVFVTIQTLNSKEEITLPNNIFIQKTIRKLNDMKETTEEGLEINLPSQQNYL